MESSSNGQYSVYMKVTNYDAKQVNTYAENLAKGYTNEGWNIIQKTVAENVIYLVMLKTFDDTRLQVLIEVDLSSGKGGIGIIMGQG